MLTPVEFRTAVVGRRPDGTVVIGLFDGLPAPLHAERTCVALLMCSQQTFEAMCTSSADGPDVSWP